LRERAIAVIGRGAADSYLAMGRALERWSAVDRLSRLKARTLLIAAEHDFTPLVEKVEMAKSLGAALAVVHGSRHGTPFDAIEATNACLFSLFADRAISPTRRWLCDGAPRSSRLARIARFVEEQTALHRLDVGVW
jgi:3-oxoadipate enol-lactonase